MIILSPVGFSSVRYVYGEIKYNFCLHIKSRRLKLFDFVECILLYIFHLRIYIQDGYSKKKM